MHSTIFQISKTPVAYDSHIESYDIQDYDYGKFGIDWIGDEREDEDGFDALEHTLPKEMFSVNHEDRTITINREGVKVVLRQMVNAIRDAANALHEDNIVNWLESYRVKMALENYRNGSALFHFENEVMTLNQFIRDVAAEDCNTYYVGAMLDYHI